MDLAHALVPRQESDKEAIYLLNRRCYRDVVERQFGLWDEDFQRAHFDRKWRESAYQKIIVRGEMAGVLVVEDHADHIFLAEIQIDPGLQGRGLGSKVLSDVIARAAEANLPVRLRVLVLSDARRLYGRHGFVVTDRTETHYLMSTGEDPVGASHP